MTGNGMAHESSWVPSDTLAARVTVLRSQLGMSRRQFAAHTGLTENQLQGIEEGRSPQKLPQKIQMICKATGVDRDWLMWGGPLKTNDPRQESPDGVSINQEYMSRKPTSPAGRKTSSPGMGRRLLASKGPANRT